MTRQEIELILLQAQASEYGLLVQTNDPDRALSVFYKVRQKLFDQVGPLLFRKVNHPEGNVAIIKRERM